MESMSYDICFCCCFAALPELAYTERTKPFFSFLLQYDGSITWLITRLFWCVGFGSALSLLSLL